MDPMLPGALDPCFIAFSSVTFLSLPCDLHGPVRRPFRAGKGLCQPGTTLDVLKDYLLAVKLGSK